MGLTISRTNLAVHLDTLRRRLVMVRGRSTGMGEDWGGTEEEYVPLQIPEEYRRLTAEERSVSVRELWQRFLSRELMVEPDFQRHYVWDLTRASRYVESLLLGLPTPPLFLSEAQDGSWEVVDGHQRLETLFRFMQPLLSGPSEAAGKPGITRTLVPLSLRALEVLSELNGQRIEALKLADRQKLWDTNLKVILLKADTPRDMKYVLFTRLNLGSVSLNNQELRNCLYRGPYNTLIAMLSESRTFLDLWGRNASDNRMRHRELLLRFFALLHRRDRYRVPYRAFLNDEMEANRELQEADQTRCRAELECAMQWVDRVFGSEALRLFRKGDGNNPQGRWGNRRVDLVYEVAMVGFAQFGASLERAWKSLQSGEQPLFRSALRSNLIDVMVNNQFTDTLDEATTGSRTVHQRFELWNGALESVVNDPKGAVDQAALIVEKLRQSNVCAVCGNQVTLDDAVLVARGGGVEAAHRFCRTNQRP